MVKRVPRCIQELEGAASQADAMAVLDRHHPLGRYGQDFPVVLAEHALTVHRLGGGNEFRRIDHVRGAARMHQDLRARQRCRQPAGAARMVQMHMREENIIDVGRIDAFGGEGAEQIRNGEMRAGVDECGAAVIDDEVTGIEPRAQMLGVDRKNARPDALVGCCHSARPQSVRNFLELRRGLGVGGPVVLEHPAQRL